jgi:hypothetical protein
MDRLGLTVSRMSLGLIGILKTSRVGEGIALCPEAWNCQVGDRCFSLSPERISKADRSMDADDVFDTNCQALVVPLTLYRD